MNDKNLIPISTQEIVVSILKAGLSSIPVGSSVASLWSDYQSHVQYRNIKDILEKHTKAIKSLEDGKLNTDYVNSPQYISDLLTTAQAAKNEMNEIKRNMYSKFLTSCCHIDNAGSSSKLLFLDYIGRLDYLDIFILKHIPCSYNGHEARKLVTEALNDEMPSGVTPEDIEMHLSYMRSIGLIELCDKDKVDRFHFIIKGVIWGINYIILSFARIHRNDS